jgi:transketolase
MTFTLVKYRNQKGKELRLCVVETLQSMIDQDKAVIALEADLGSASGFTKIQTSHPQNFVQCGIAEANMVGVSAGLSLEGYKPFLHTFAPFATRRVFDQLYVSGAYAKTTMNIYGSDPGFTVGLNGGTHTSFEDVALMRTIPNAVVCDAADATQLEWILREFSMIEGVHYIRANRKAVRNIYEKGSTFEVGKANVLTKGNDVLIIASGQLVSEALDCANQLEENNISVTVIDMFTIKPLDVACILRHATDKKAVVTFENHSIIGGLGSAVAETLTEHRIHVPFKRVGVNDIFGEVGTPEYLQSKYGLTAIDLEHHIYQLLK